MPVDAEGLVVDALPDDARLVYVSPSHQFPLGMVMSLRRRRALLDWAERVDAAIVEDDYDSEFRFGGRPVEPLHGLDTSGRVLYVGSFSKVLLPTLRLGFVIAPPPLHAALHKAKHVADWHTSVPLQTTAAAFIEQGHLGRHIRRMRGVYTDRHLAILRELSGPLSAHLEPIPSVAGLHVAARLRDARRRHGRRGGGPRRAARRRPAATVDVPDGGHRDATGLPARLRGDRRRRHPGGAAAAARLPGVMRG